MKPSSLLQIFVVASLLTVSVNFIPISSADSNSISLHITDFDEPYIIDLPPNKDVSSVQVINSLSLYTPSDPPNSQLFTTDEMQPEMGLSDPVYYDQYTTEVLKQGPDKHLYVYAPSTYYDGGYEIETYSLDLQINLENEPTAPLFTPETTYEYVVITTTTLWSTFNTNFKQWKIDNDDKITNILISNISDIITIPDCWVNGTYGDATDNAHGNHWVDTGKAITSNYNMFNDTQAKIRNYIRCCYDTYGTRYVLLAGNKDLVPPRIMFNAAHSGPGGTWYNWTSAVDMYYSCLNNNWNNNTNSRWGEDHLDFYWCHTTVWDDIDWGYDVTLGRLLINSVNEANYWITKLKEYVDGNDYTKGNYLNNGIIAGKDPSNNIDPYVWDRIHDEFPSNLTWVNNYTITQPQWSVMDDYCNGAVSPYDGIQILYHSGHGGTETPYLTANLNNSERPQALFYTEGCQTADFGGSTTTRTENLFSGIGGFVCDISNSAYGWFEASTWYSEEMFSLMFNTSNERCFAKAHDQSRINFGHTAHSVCPMIVKETNFFGDPALEFNFYNPEEENLPPTITNPSPMNGSTDRNTSFLWTVDIADPEGQQMNWNLDCSNGQTNTGSSYNTTISLILSNLQYSTTYIVLVNISDGDNDASQWYNFTIKSSPPMNPENGSHYEGVYGLYFNFTPLEDGTVSFYWGNDTLIHSIYANASETASIYLPDFTDPDWLIHDHTYYWYVISNGTREPNYNFKTSKSWDLNEDLTVDYLDVSGFVSHYEDRVTPAGKDAWDINEDTYTNYLDLSALACHYGEEYL